MSDDYTLRKEYLDNQVHGGTVINTSILMLFQTIRDGRTGERDFAIILKSLPENDYEKIKHQIQRIDAEYAPKLKQYEIKLRGVPRSEREAQEIERVNLISSCVLEKVQVVITFLDSIGQWWMKKPSVPINILSLEDEKTPEEYPPKPPP